MKKLVKGLIFLVVVLLVLVGGAFILLSIPKTAGVEYTDADLDSYIEAIGITFTENNASIEDIFFENYSASGSLEVEGTLSSEQASALANAVINEKSILRNIQIKFAGDDYVIASATIGNDLTFVYDLFPVAERYKTIVETVKGRPIYIETSLTYSPETEFFAMLETVNVGLIPFPVDQANVYGTEIGTILNRVLRELPGFEVEAFKVNADGLHFNGSIPQETESFVNTATD